MIVLFNRVGDRLLRAILPQAKAAAGYYYCNYACRSCYNGYCYYKYNCWYSDSTAPGPSYCRIYTPVGSNYTQYGWCYC